MSNLWDSWLRSNVIDAVEVREHTPRAGDAPVPPVRRPPPDCAPTAENRPRWTAADEQWRWIQRISNWTDEAFEIPGLDVRFGVDPLLGLVPVVGDLAGTILSAWILLAAAQLGVPRITLARMLLNVGIDFILGSIPLVGAVADFAWKANARNVALLERTLPTSLPQRRTQRAFDWLFVGGVLALLLAMFIGSLVAAIFIAQWIASLIASLF
jgi:hypothetical protein